MHGACRDVRSGKQMCAFSLEGAGSSLRESSPPPHPTAGRELGGLLSSTCGPGKPKSYVCLFQYLSIHAGGEAMRESSPGSIPPRREGEREKLSASGMCSLLCHLLLARAPPCPGHHTALVEKARSRANPPCLEVLRAIFRGFGKERGVIGCYQDENM